MLAAFNYYVFLGYRNIFVFFYRGFDARAATSDDGRDMPPQPMPTGTAHSPRTAASGLGGFRRARGRAKSGN